MLEYRPAQFADIPALMEIRGAVRENRLVQLRLSFDDYAQALSVDGQAWVCQDDGRLVGFVCGRPGRKDVWALFVRPESEGRGIGSALLDWVEAWLFDQGLDEVTLSTAPGTRAEALYLSRGWQAVGTSGGEVTYRLRRPASDAR